MFVDTHCHLDGEEFNEDRVEVMQRAREAGCKAIFLPAIDLLSSQHIVKLAQQYPDYLYPMIGLHPEEVRDDWREQLAEIKTILPSPLLRPFGSKRAELERTLHPSPIIAIGEVGLDFYWSREFEKEQLEAFEEQVQWSVETQLPLMIHCRKAQNEMVHILKRYADKLPGGVFHCFTGNEKEAAELLQFDRFVLGIGGVLTFKRSHLPEVLPTTVPLERLVLETDAPYMAPVPMRGQRNESSYIRYIITRLAEAYGMDETVICHHTNENVKKVFGVQV